MFNNRVLSSFAVDCRHFEIQNSLFEVPRFAFVRLSYDLLSNYPMRKTLLTPIAIVADARTSFTLDFRCNVSLFLVELKPT